MPITYRKKVWVVGSAQFLITNSVVVILVHVMHRDTTCPQNSARANRRVQTLFHRAPKLFKKAEGELYTITGRLGASSLASGDSGRSTSVRSCFLESWLSSMETDMATVGRLVSFWRAHPHL